jgi:hypothetical protein
MRTNALADYRLLWFDDGGGMTGAEWLEARSDSEALAVLNCRNLLPRFELWCDQRLVAQAGGNEFPAARQMTG